MVSKELRRAVALLATFRRPSCYSVLKGDAGEVALTPNQPTFSDRAKIVKGQFEIGRQDVDVFQPNSGADVGDVAQAATEYTALGGKKQQGALRDLRPAN
jgi:hypothetical protein